MSTPPIGAVLTAESDWIEWYGGENPVPGEVVCYKNRCGGFGDALSESLGGWVHGSHLNDPSFDIIAYRVVLSQAQEPSVPAEEGGLLPCPFCGDDDPEITGEGGWVWVACTTGTDCAGRGPDSDDEASAITAWNTRSLPAPEASGAGGWRLGDLHTAMMDALREDIERQHAGSFTEDTDAEIVIPVGAVPVQLYVKLDVSALAEAIVVLLSEKAGLENPAPMPRTDSRSVTSLFYSFFPFVQVETVCICMTRGGPEGCGICNETGRRSWNTYPAAPVQADTEEVGA